MVAAPPEAVGAPYLPDVEPEGELVGQFLDEARDVARRRIVEAAPAALRGDQLLSPVAAHAFREDADIVVVAIAVGAAARPEERRVGTGGVSQSDTRGPPQHEQKKTKT